MVSLILSLIITTFFGQSSQPSLSVKKNNEPIKINQISLGIKTTAKSIVVIDEKSGQVLFAKNPDQVLPIASITKLMSVLVFLDHNPGWDKEVEIKEEDKITAGRLYLGRGEKVTVRNLFYSALVSSTNQSVLALSRSTNLAKEQFVEKMNQKAKELGMSKTTFTEPTGLDPQNQSTVLDLIKLLNEALKKDEIKKALTSKTYTFKTFNHRQQTITVVNTDRLLDSFLNDSKSGYKILGAKTGSLVEAGYCFAVKLKKENQPITIVSLGSATSFDRFQEIKGLASWIYENYQWPKEGYSNLN
ncbi:MAG: serine hydrolase [bacterium]